jgi:4-hydroxy-tetrahydrodipicolinate synthase
MRTDKRIFGIIPPTVTPFTPDEALDEGALRREIRLLFEAGVHGVSFGGSTGEGALLTDEELARGVTVIREENRNNLPVLCGIIRNSVRQGISASLVAKKAGADCLMVTPTYYHGTDDEGNIVYFSEIVKVVGLPVIIYNVIAANPISPALMSRLYKIDGIIGIKQAVGGIHAFTDMIAACQNKALVFGAQDDLLVADYLLGGAGAISAILALFPKLCVEQWEAVQKGNISQAVEMHYRMLPVWRKIEGGAFPGKIKAALNLLGRNVGKARRPILEPSVEEIKTLAEALRESGFIK